jgi:hypothetical protein
MGALRLFALLTIALGVIAFFAPGRAAIAARVYALALCAEVLVLVLTALRRAYPAESRIRQPSAAGAKRQPPPSLARIELEAALGVASSFELHHRLVPRLRSIAAGLLASRRRVSLDARPETARAVLGDATWELVRPDRRAPEDRLGRGITPPELAHVVDSLEGV